MITLKLLRQEVEALIEILEEDEGIPLHDSTRGDLAEEFRERCGMVSREQEEKNKRKRRGKKTIFFPSVKVYQGDFGSIALVPSLFKKQK